MSKKVFRCVSCGNTTDKPYARTIRYDKNKSQWYEDGGFLCSEVCGQLWSRKTGEDFTTGRL